jgi:hypothetical protein
MAVDTVKRRDYHVAQNGRPMASAAQPPCVGASSLQCSFRFSGDEDDLWPVRVERAAVLTSAPRFEQAGNLLLVVEQVAIAGFAKMSDKHLRQAGSPQVETVSHEQREHGTPARSKIVRALKRKACWGRSSESGARPHKTAVRMRGLLLCLLYTHP